MKKIFIILVLFSLLFTLSSCGGNGRKGSIEKNYEIDRTVDDILGDLGM